MTNATKAGRPAKWSGPTRAIRVPEALADHLLDIARQLDNPPPDNVQNPNGLPICKPASDAATIAQGLEEGWIVPKAPPQESRRYLVSWGEEQYLLEDPGNLSPKDQLAVEQAVDRFWRATSGMSQDEHLYVLGQLASQWGRPICSLD